jgi:azobenzene reductase
MKDEEKTSMHITLIAGSLREHSNSTKLLRYMQTELKKKGAEVNLIDLRTAPVPIYNPDAASSDPNTSKLIDSVQKADGVILATPEYHGSISGALKNALDYMGKAQFAGKAVLSVCSSGGAVGVSSLTHLQGIVRNVHGINCPEWISIGGEQRRFTPEGAPESEAVVQRVDRALDELLRLARRLRH